MKSVPVAAAVQPAAVRARHRAADFVALTKPRLNLLVVVTSAAGYYLGSRTAADVVPMAEAVVGTALVAGGAAVLNQVYERDTDRLMRRTRMRPLPDGRVSPAEARWYGLLLAATGLLVLAVDTNALATLLAFTTLVTYLLVYTPMKRRTPAATLVGAVPGALPPLIGWTASHGGVSPGGASLFAIVFLWQIPHFMAIAWLYRDDYARAKFPMLPVVEPDGRRTGRQAVIYSAALLLASAAPTAAGVSRFAYLAVALAGGAMMVWLSIAFASTRTDAAARRLFIGSIVYLPVLWAAMILDRVN
jgi:protoheme IX farnesyltransferase